MSQSHSEDKPPDRTAQELSAPTSTRVSEDPINFMTPLTTPINNNKKDSDNNDNKKVSSSTNSDAKSAATSPSSPEINLKSRSRNRSNSKSRNKGSPGNNSNSSRSKLNKADFAPRRSLPNNLSLPGGGITLPGSLTLGNNVHKTSTAALASGLGTVTKSGLLGGRTISKEIKSLKQRSYTGQGVNGVSGSSASNGSNSSNAARNRSQSNNVGVGSSASLGSNNSGGSSPFSGLTNLVPTSVTSTLSNVFSPLATVSANPLTNIGNIPNPIGKIPNPLAVVKKSNSKSTGALEKLASAAGGLISGTESGSGFDSSCTDDNFSSRKGSQENLQKLEVKQKQGSGDDSCKVQSSSGKKNKNKKRKTSSDSNSFEEEVLSEKVNSYGERVGSAVDETTGSTVATKVDSDKGDRDDHAANTATGNLRKRKGPGKNNQEGNNQQGPGKISNDDISKLKEDPNYTITKRDPAESSSALSDIIDDGTSGLSRSCSNITTITQSLSGSIPMLPGGSSSLDGSRRQRSSDPHVIGSESIREEELGEADETKKEKSSKSKNKKNNHSTSSTSELKESNLKSKKDSPIQEAGKESSTTKTSPSTDTSSDIGCLAAIENMKKSPNSPKTPLIDTDLLNKDDDSEPGRALSRENSPTSGSPTAGNSSQNQVKSLGRLAITIMVFFNVCGGPWGSEQIFSLGPLPGLLSLLFITIFWAYPQCELTAELGCCFPVNGGVSIWINESWGPFWGLQASYWSWVSSLVCSSNNCVLLVDGFMV